MKKLKVACSFFFFLPCCRVVVVVAHVMGGSPIQKIKNFDDTYVQKKKNIASRVISKSSSSADRSFLFSVLVVLSWVRSLATRSSKNSALKSVANLERMDEEERTEEGAAAKTTWTTSVSLSTTTIIQLLMTSLGGFLCFLPCFLGTPSCVETSTLRASLSSVQYGYSAVTLIVLTIPLMIEMIIDGLLYLYQSYFVRNRQQSTYILDTTVIRPYTYSFNTPEKMLFIIGIIIQPLVAFLPADTTNLGQLYICCNKCQIMLVGGTFASWLCRYDSRHFGVYSMSMFIGILVISMSLQVFGDNMSNCVNMNQVLCIQDLFSLFIHKMVPFDASFTFLSILSYPYLFFIP